MKFQTDPVSANLLHYGIAVCLGMGVDGVSNISQMSPGLCLGQAEMNAFFRYADDALGALGNLSQSEHAGRVGKVTVQAGGHVYIDNIALPQDDVFIRNAVADFVVDRGADAFWKSLVVERRRDPAVAGGKIIYDPVDLRGAHADMDMLLHLVQYSCV